MTISKQLHHLYIRSISSLIWLNEKIFFYPKLKRVYQQAFQGQKEVTILDVGANRGQSIDFFLSILPKAIIHSFEPNPGLFKDLKKKYTNPCIHLYEKGISSTTGTLTFYEHVLDETSGFELAAADSTYNDLKNRILFTKKEAAIKAAYEVSVTTLDAFVAQKDIGKIDILKIDVEGHELHVIQGTMILLKEKRIRYLQMEQHFDDQYKGEFSIIRELLEQVGYLEEIRLKHGFGDFYEIIYKSQ